MTASDDALSIARHIEWSVRFDAHYQEHGESYDPANPVPSFTEPEPTSPDPKYMDDRETFACLARSVIEQHEQLDVAIACGRCGRGDLRLRDLPQHTMSCLSRTDEEERIAALEEENRKLHEFIDAAKECADAAAIPTLQAENERMRGELNDVLAQLQIEKVAGRMRLERDMALERVQELEAVLKAAVPLDGTFVARALEEACDLHDEMSRKGWNCDSLVKEHGVADDRIAELRKLANAVISAHPPARRTDIQ